MVAIALMGGVVAAQTKTSSASGIRADEVSLDREVKARPRDGSLWFDLGVVRAQHGETSAAISAFQHAEALTQDNLAAYRNVVALALRNNDLPLAGLTCRRALARYPKDPELLQNYAYVLVSTSKFFEAEAPLRTLKRLRPTDVAVRVSLISALQESGDSAQSDVELNELFTASLLSRDQAIRLVRDFQRQNKTHAAQETSAYVALTWPSGEMNRLTAGAVAQNAPESVTVPGSIEPDSARSAMLAATLERATELIHSERYLDAMHFLADARAQFPNQPEVEYRSALTDVCLQRYAEAIATLQRMKQQRSDSAKVEFLLGGSFEISGDDQNADSAYRAAAALEPANFLYHRVLGALWQKEGKFVESSVPLQEALALQPDDSVTLVLLARAREKAGDLNDATSLLEHAVRSDPTSRRAHTALATLYFKQKRLPDAEQEQAIAARLEDQRIQQWTLWGADPQLKN